MSKKYYGRQSMAFEVKYLGPTNTLGGRVQISSWDLKRNKKTSKVIGICYEIGDTLSQAINLINECELEFVGHNSSNPSHYTIFYKWDFDKLESFFKKGKK